MVETDRIQVVAAIFINESKEVFCARRRDNGNLALKWEFPGGKIECGESHEHALIREIKEELDLEIKVEEFFMSINYDYDDSSVSLFSYLCTITSGSLKLRVHSESIWISLEEIERLDWALADIPIVKGLIKQQ